MPPPSFASFPDFEAAAPSEAKRDKSKPKKSRKSKEIKEYKDSKPKSSKVELSTAQQAQDIHDRVYFSDSKGDRMNVQYGRPDKVPRYSLFARGRKILGLSPACTVIHRSSNAVEVATDGLRFKGASELSDSRAKRLLALAPVRRITNSRSSDKYEEVDGVIPLPSSHRFSALESSRSITQEDDRDSDWGSKDSETHSESSEDEEGHIHLTSQQEKIKSLEERLQLDPTSVQSWLALLAQNLSDIPLSSRNASSARAEVALSILSRCIAAHPDNASSKIVRLKYLSAGQEIWHASKLRSEWEEVLQKMSDPDIWLEWLGWIVRTPGSGIDGVLEAARRALAAVHDEVGQIRILWRMAVILASSGFTERAIALFQAQGELLFSRPLSLENASFSNILDNLEEFWEAEVPRLGEKNAEGWSAWLDAGSPVNNSPMPPPTFPPPIPSTSNQDPYVVWATNESEQDRKSVFPTRSTDESEDPYSTVLFSDIRDLLVLANSRQAKDVFRKAWLSFIGLPIPGFTASVSELGWDDQWSLTHLSHSEYLHAIVPLNGKHILPSDSVAGVSVGREQEYARSFGPVSCWGLETRRPLDSLVDGKGEGCSFWTQRYVQGIQHEYTRNLFGKLRLEDEDVEWDGLSLAFEAALNVKSAFKISRTILSQRQSSLPLWMNHAIIERLRGRMDEAQKVYHTVLVASPSDDPFQAILWWDWAEMEWLRGRKDDATQAIMNAARVKGSGSIVLLRAKGALQSRIRGASSDWRTREAWVKIRALLELLATNDPVAVMDVFDEHLPGTSEGNAKESFVVACLSLVYRHSVVLKNPSPPFLLQQRARDAVSLYPSNSIILGILLESEKGFGIYGHFKELRNDPTQERDLAGRVEDVWLASWKKGKWTNELEKTRTGLMAAVESDRLKGSAILWRIFIEVELRSGDLKKAKRLLYLAVSACPLSKDLYLLAFGPLRSVFERHELVQFGDRMSEQLRLRTGLDEIVIRANEPASDSEMDTDDEEEDEIVDRAKEMKRLMPY